MKRLDRRLALNCQILNSCRHAPGLRMQCVVCTKLRDGIGAASFAPSPKDRWWPHKCPIVVSITRARDGQVVPAGRLHFRAEPLLSGSMTRTPCSMATYFLSGSRSDRKPGWLRRSVAALTAAALSLTLAMPAHAQGRVAVVRDAEIETLLRDYANPIFKAAGLMTSRVQIVLVNDPSFNAFVDGQRMFINTGALADSGWFRTRSSACSPMRPDTLPAATSRDCANRSPLPRRWPSSAACLGMGALAAGSISGSDTGAQAGGALITATPSAGTAQPAELPAVGGDERRSGCRALSQRHRAVDPQGMLTTFQRFSRSLSLSGVQVDPYQISHPLPRERIALLEELARKSKHFDARDPAALNQRHQSDASQDRRLYRWRTGGGQDVLG
jgi:hypothetical protein